MRMSLSPPVQLLSAGVLARQSRCCISTSSQSWRIGRVRPMEPDEVERMDREERKTLSRRVYEKLGFHPPYLEKSEEFKPYVEFHPRKRPIEEHALYKERAAFVFAHQQRLQEGLRQTLWLTKSVLMEEKMPEGVMQTAADITIPDMERRVRDSIRESRQFDTREKVIRRKRYIYTQVLGLLRLSNMLGPEQTLDRMITEEPRVVASWDREGDHIQVSGEPQSLLVSSRTPLPVAAGPEQVEETRGLELPTFHPLHPTIDLKSSHLYTPHQNSSGFASPCPFPHAHTRIVFNRMKWRPEHSLSQAIMYTFADGFSRAKEIYGPDFRSDLETPVVFQGIETDGVSFSFITAQINTLDTDPNHGTKNMLWVDREENLLYTDMYPQDIKKFNRGGNKHNRVMIRLFIKKRDPEVGCQDLNLRTFQKFLAFMANR